MLYGEDMYIIEDEYDENDYQYNVKKAKKNYSNKTKIAIVISVIVLIIGLIIINKIVSYRDSYQFYEKQLEQKAREYVKNNNFSFNKETYLLATEIDYDLSDECSLVSGVFVENDSYNAYLVCKDYKTKLISNSKEYIDLNDLDVFIIPKGAKYVDGYKKNKDNIEIETKGFVGTDAGVYNLNYVITEGSRIVDNLNKKVVIVDNDYIRSFYPTITLRGNSIEYILINTEYNDKSVDVTDKNEIINNITTISNLNINRAGEYSINYIATNSKGYTSVEERKIYVVSDMDMINANTIITPTTLTSDEVEITLSINSNLYQYTILPNQVKTTNSTFKYTVKENGIYTFLIYDDNSVTTRYVKIENIDHSVPEGTCVAKVYNNYTDVSINANSNNGISSYTYKADNVIKGINSSNQYRLDVTNPKNIVVSVKDGIGNMSNITCKIQTMDPSIGNNNITYLNTLGSEYVVVNTNTSVTEFEKKVKGIISQNSNTELYGSSCLGFAEYHTCKLVYLKSGEEMSADLASKYIIGCIQEDYKTNNKQEILGIIHDEILAGYPLVLMVNGNEGRHFVTVVGYRRNAYTKYEIQESDLLIIDAWDGKIETMDKTVDSNSRYMYRQEGMYWIRKIKHN